MTRPMPFRRSILLVLTLAVSSSAIFVLSDSLAVASGTQVLRISARAHMVLRFSTNRLHARHGRIEIIMHNPLNSGMRHGIAIKGNGVRKVGRIVSPGHSTSVTVSLRRGRYTFYCPVPGHLQAGMKGTLTVS